MSAFSQLREDFMMLTKARLSFLVVFTTAFGYLVAVKGGDFSGWTLFHTVFGTVLSAFGAAVFNQLMEIDADAVMERTSDRPLAAQRMPRGLAFVIGWVLCAFGMIHLGMKVNATAAYLAGATLLTYLFVYTPLKKRSTFNTIVGAVSGAIPPLIGWAAGDQSLLSWGTLFLFGLLFFWQLPHFAAINWMYREEYERGGFVMWSNDDEDGARTSKLAVLFSVCLLILQVGLVFSGIMHWWAAIAGGLLAGAMLWLAVKFRKTRDRKDARSLFFFTLLYLPLAMAVSYFAWTA